MKIMLMVLLLAAMPAMSQTEKEIAETWVAAEMGLAGSGEKATLLRQATIGAKLDLENLVKDSFAAICKERDAYAKDPAAFSKEIDRINAEWHRQRLAHYHAVHNLLDSTEQAALENAIASGISVTVHGDSVVSYAELLATSRTTVLKSLNRICGEQP